MPLKQALGWTLQATVRFLEPEWPVTGGLSVSEGSISAAQSSSRRVLISVER